MDLTKIDNQMLDKAIRLFVEKRKEYHRVLDNLLEGKKLGELSEKEQLEILELVKKEANKNTLK